MKQYLRKISRGLIYLFVNPKYFFSYFFGKPEVVLNTLTVQPPNRFLELRDELNEEGKFFEELRERTSRIAKEDFEVNVDHYFLYALVRIIKPQLILETGVFDGYFTACILKGLSENLTRDGVDGKCVSIDLPAYSPIKDSTNEMARTCLPKGCEVGWVIPENLKAHWQLYLGDSRDLLPKVAKEVGNITLFFHDSLHTYDHMTSEYETVWPLLQNGAYLMSHDIHWNSAFREFVRRHRQKEATTHGFGIIQKR